MNWHLFEIAINLYQGFLFIFFVRKVLSYRRPSLYVDGLFVLTIGALLSLHQFLNPPVPDTLIFILPLVHALRFSDEKWYVCLFWCMVLGIITIGMTELCGCLLSGMWSVDWSALLSQTAARLTYVVGTNIMITIAIAIIAFARRKRSQASWRIAGIFLAALTIELMTNEVIYHLQALHPEGQDSYVWISAFSLATVGLIILLYETMNRMSEQQRIAELTAQTADHNQAYQEELKLVYRSMLAEQHDLRHRLDIAEKMLAESDTTTTGHISEILADSESTAAPATGNIAVDAVLSAKASAMRNSGIDFSYSGIPLNSLPVSETEFCVLLSNLLDNAIEGVMRLPAGASSRSVRLLISRTWNMYAIVCENDMNAETLNKQGDIWVSSKPNSSAHGFGTRSIRKIVESADGFVEFDPCGERFAVRILIPDKG